jgi:RNA polymerase sigma-70 factor (ECF subfamily)
MLLGKLLRGKTPEPVFLSDEVILEKFRINGQEEYAFNQLMQKYQKNVYSLIRRMVISHDDANDITQDVFIKCWIKLADFRGESKLFTWLYRIATNETINFLKQKRRRMFIPSSTMENRLSRMLDDSVHFSGDDIQKKLQQALLKLPDKQRLVVNLRSYNEMEYNEMSALLGTSEGALKASYHHAVKKVEKYIFYS